MQVEQKIADLGLQLARSPAPLANFVQAVRTGDLLFVAGHLPQHPDGSLLNPGKVGRDVTIEQGYEAARLTMTNCLASIGEALGAAGVFLPRNSFGANGPAPRGSRG